jgi:hypothetical protein
MKSLAIAVVVIAVVIVALGFWRGWFDLGGKQEDGKVGANLDINVNKLKADKEAFKKELGEKSKAMKEKMASLKTKAKGLSEEAKADVEKEIEALGKQHETLEKKMSEVEESTEEKFTELKNWLKRESGAGTGGGKEKAEGKSR